MIKYKNVRKKFLSKDEENEMFTKYKSNRTEKMKNEIIENYSALAFFYAKKMSHQKHQYEDIVQEAFLGLSIAIDKFEVASNCRFVHYAGFWIKAQIYNFVFENYTIVNIPTSPSFMKGFWKMKKMKDMTSQEIAIKLNIPITQVEILRSITSPASVVSLDIKDKNDAGNPDYAMNHASLKKCMENMSVTTFEEGFIEKQENNSKLNKINQALKCLKPQEQDVIIEYFMEEKTFDEIGKKYEVTRQRIEQIQKNAIRKIKENLNEVEINGG